MSNAVDAMSPGGTLTLNVRCETQNDGKTMALIEVVDTGQGIPPDVMPRVMDPFFTTKAEGKGTGLGLAICRRIVQEHQGTIQIDSIPGKGTTVRITLPGSNATNAEALNAE